MEIKNIPVGWLKTGPFKDLTTAGEITWIVFPKLFFNIRHNLDYIMGSLSIPYAFSEEAIQTPTHILMLVYLIGREKGNENMTSKQEIYLQRQVYYIDEKTASIKTKYSATDTEDLHPITNMILETFESFGEVKNLWIIYRIPVTQTLLPQLWNLHVNIDQLAINIPFLKARKITIFSNVFPPFVYSALRTTAYFRHPKLPRNLVISQNLAHELVFLLRKHPRLKNLNPEKLAEEVAFLMKLKNRIPDESVEKIIRFGIYLILRDIFTKTIKGLPISDAEITERWEQYFPKLTSSELSISQNKSISEKEIFKTIADEIFGSPFLAFELKKNSSEENGRDQSKEDINSTRDFLTRMLRRGLMYSCEQAQTKDPRAPLIDLHVSAWRSETHIHRLFPSTFRGFLELLQRSKTANTDNREMWIQLFGRNINLDSYSEIAAAAYENLTLWESIYLSHENLSLKLALNKAIFRLIHEISGDLSKILENFLQKHPYLLHELVFLPIPYKIRTKELMLGKFPRYSEFFEEILLANPRLEEFIHPDDLPYLRVDPRENPLYSLSFAARKFAQMEFQIGGMRRIDIFSPEFKIICYALGFVLGPLYTLHKEKLDDISKITLETIENIAQNLPPNVNYRWHNIYRNITSRLTDSWEYHSVLTLITDAMLASYAYQEIFAVPTRVFKWVKLGMKFDLPALTGRALVALYRRWLSV